MVAQVDDDAIRWAKALRRAIEMEKVEKVEDDIFCDAFLTHWNGWVNGHGEPVRVPLGAAWRDRISELRKRPGGRLMAQDFAPLLRSIWSDEDWRALTMDAQHVYLMLLSHPDRNSAGVLSMTLRKWTRLAADLSPDRLDAALAELDAAGFIVMDEETEEVLVRAFVRRATVYKHIRMMANALREISEVESERLKSALGQELMRLPRLAVPTTNTKMAEEAERTQQRLDDLASMLCDAPPDPPGQSVVHPMGHPMADPMAHPHVVVAGAVAGAGAVAAGGPEKAFSEYESLEVTRARACDWWRSATCTRANSRTTAAAASPSGRPRRDRPQLPGLPLLDARRRQARAARHVVGVGTQAGAGGCGGCGQGGEGQADGQAMTATLTRTQAACANHPHTDWWLSGVKADRDRAIAICRTCPLMASCREDAVRRRLTDAVRGGLTGPELRKLAGAVRGGRCGTTGRATSAASATAGPAARPTRRTWLGGVHGVALSQSERPCSWSYREGSSP
jgi:hypothetical protein